MLKLLQTTAYDRIKKLKSTGNLDHGNKGKQNRKPRADKQQIIDLAAKYEDFGISHVCELLESREGIMVNRETLRRWLARPRVRNIPKQRQRREPMANFGELLQI
jgi:transposase